HSRVAVPPTLSSLSSGCAPTHSTCLVAIPAPPVFSEYTLTVIGYIFSSTGRPLYRNGTVKVFGWEAAIKASVTTYYLEMTDPLQLRPAARPSPELVIRRAEIVCPELNRFLYTAVGGSWYWIDRLPWTYQKWL